MVKKLNICFLNISVKNVQTNLTALYYARKVYAMALTFLLLPHILIIQCPLSTITVTITNASPQPPRLTTVIHPCIVKRCVAQSMSPKRPHTTMAH